MQPQQPRSANSHKLMVLDSAIVRICYGDGVRRGPCADKRKLTSFCRFRVCSSNTYAACLYSTTLLLIPLFVLLCDADSNV